MKELTVELVDTCNLHCSYCVRDDRQLYGKMHALPVPLLDRVLGEVKAAWGHVHVGFTGGETTLHPRFEDALATVTLHGLRCNFVTNGWHFERVLPAVLRQRASLTDVAFSLDGITAEAHDRWRGAGSFERVVRALALCAETKIPATIKVVLRRDTAPHVARFCLFAARMGARGIMFGPFFPTGEASESLMCSIPQQEDALRELAFLKKNLRLEVGLAAGLYDPRPEPTCLPLGGASANLDFRGQLTLCCVLSGFRGAERPDDVLADLSTTSWADGAEALARIVSAHNAQRSAAFQSLLGAAPPLHTGSSCLYCIHSFGKGAATATEMKAPPAAIGNADRFTLAEGRIFAKGDTGAMVVDSVRGGRTLLNETAAFILERLLAGDDIATSAISLQATFAIDGVDARAAVTRTITSLLRSREVALLRP